MPFRMDICAIFRSLSFAQSDVIFSSEAYSYGFARAIGDLGRTLMICCSQQAILIPLFSGNIYPYNITI